MAVEDAIAGGLTERACAVVDLSERGLRQWRAFLKRATTPHQKHSGEWDGILGAREEIKTKTFAAWRAYHTVSRGQHTVVEADIS